jgi:hypothetical protein
MAQKDVLLAEKEVEIAGSHDELVSGPCRWWRGGSLSTMHHVHKAERRSRGLARSLW